MQKHNRALTIKNLNNKLGRHVYWELSEILIKIPRDFVDLNKKRYQNNLSMFCKMPNKKCIICPHLAAVVVVVGAHIIVCAKALLAKFCWNHPTRTPCLPHFMITSNYLLTEKIRINHLYLSMFTESIQTRRLLTKIKDGFFFWSFATSLDKAHRDLTSGNGNLIK